MRVCVRVCVQVEMSSCMGQGLVSSGSGPLALENPAFLGPDLGAQGKLKKKAEAASHLAVKSNELSCGIPQRWGWEMLGGAGRVCILVFGQGGCGAFQRRLGRVSVAGAASGDSRHQEMALRCILRPQGRGLGLLWGWHQIVYDTVNLSSLILL